MTFSNPKRAQDSKLTVATCEREAVSFRDDQARAAGSNEHVTEMRTVLARGCAPTVQWTRCTANKTRRQRLEKSLRRPGLRIWPSGAAPRSGDLAPQQKRTAMPQCACAPHRFMSGGATNFKIQIQQPIPKKRDRGPGSAGGSAPRGICGPPGFSHPCRLHREDLKNAKMAHERQLHRRALGLDTLRPPILCGVDHGRNRVHPRLKRS